ncbi:DUF1194 domain-containing protein [Amylibacter sp. IMCC11727]|uniref:DUF1194 domain-containing protein n=1 Tax=Amylibacter sp. IMCC11727 TaxID=3039851 RepID=UPI00244DC5B1|nr:DUF1194 domain-containing protein [Amylibacter sp. IMCC11727]WGI20797.1 DUF1194 domain-containing protein [Amylibacter sp. IMCC11727]
MRRNLDIWTKKKAGLVRLSVMGVMCGVFVAMAQTALACRQALVLAVDVSASVSTREYELQRDGIAAALRDPEVIDWIVAPAGSEVELFIFEFGNRNYQWYWVNWTKITSEAVLAQVADTVAAVQRNRESQSTGLGEAILAGADALASRTCAQKTIDVSGDGKNNVGVRPQDVKDRLRADGITVNGLVIATQDIAEMSAYYNANVIVGDGSFVETAGGFEDYARAMKRKLLRELVPKLAMVAE